MNDQTNWKKRAHELADVHGALDEEQALLLGIEMADARAEEIAQRIISNVTECTSDSYVDGWHTACMQAANICRSTLVNRSEAEIIEDALKEISDEPCLYDTPKEHCPRCIARKALGLDDDHR